MSTLSYIGLIGGILTFLGYVPYAKRIVRGEIKPERASWLIWTLCSALVLLSYYSLGARTTIWVPLAYVLGSATITILSFRYGQEGWGILEKVSLLIAIITGIRWIFFDNVLLALVLNLALNFISYVRTIHRLATHRTEEEDVPGWALYFFGAVLNVVAIATWAPSISGLPIMILVMSGITLFLVLRNQAHKRKRASAESPQTETIE
jgi:hypothetical protein